MVTAIFLGGKQMERNIQTINSLIDILDLSKEDGEMVKDAIKKEGLLKFVNGKGQEQLPSDVCEKVSALHEILLLVQDDDPFLMGGDLGDK